MDENALRAEQGQGQPVLSQIHPVAGQPYIVVDVDWRGWGLPCPIIADPAATDSIANTARVDADNGSIPVYADVDWETPRRVC